MGKVRNIVFSAAVAVCLCFVGVYYVLVELTPLEFETSWTESRSYSGIAEVTVENIVSGELQDSIDLALTVRVPARDAIMLAWSAVQRAVIAVANLPFGFAAYPTYYGSGYVYVPEYGAVLDGALTTDDVSEEEVAGYAETISAIIESAPDVEWLFCLVDRDATTAANPSHDLVSDPADYSWYEEHFLALLPSSCTVIDLSYDSSDEFFENFFLTDHHWRITGAIAAYAQIIAALGKDAIEFGEVVVGFDGEFWGSGTRLGLAFTDEADKVYDVLYDASELTVTINGSKTGDGSLLDVGVGNATQPHLLADMHWYYFHADYGVIKIVNNDLDNGEALLIIADSYSNSLERFFAESYQYVYVLDPRHTSIEITEFLTSHDVDAAIFLMGYNTLVDVTS